jgi:hypothetical protein
VSLPNLDNVVINDAKVRDYLLSPEHPVGRFKAVFFNALGYSRDDWEVLRAHLLELVRSGTAIPQPPGTYGQKFELSGTIIGPPVERRRSRPSGSSGQRRTSPASSPEVGLRRGDLGVVVELYGDDGLEVEFVAVSGRTQAVVTLQATDVRAIDDRDLLAVRSLERAAG